MRKSGVKVPGVPMADCHSSRANGYAKTRKNRAERQRAKRDPETQPLYGGYRGYLS